MTIRAEQRRVTREAARFLRRAAGVSRRAAVRRVHRHGARAILVALLLAGVCVGLTAQNGAPRTTRRASTLAGRIIHPEGAAAEGARVAVYAAVDGGAGGIVATAITAHDGRYEISGLPAGSFFIGVTPLKGGGFGGAVSRPATAPVETFYPGVTDRDRALPITLFDSVPAEGIDVWLAPAPQRYSISGRIHWPENVTVERITIEYGGPDAVRRGLWHVTDPGGLFTIDGVGPETYVLLARAETSSGPLLAIASTDAAAGPVEDMRLTLREPGRIHGRVVAEGSAALPSRPNKVVPEQRLLTLSPLYPVAAAEVDSDGRFAIGEVVGEYTLYVEGLPPGWRVKRIARSGTPLAGDRIVVGAAEDITGVEIVVGTGPA